MFEKFVCFALLYICTSFVLAGNDFFDDASSLSVNSKQNKNSDNFFSDDVDEIFDAEGTLEEVESVIVKRKLKQAKQKKERKIKELEEFCPTNHTITLMPTSAPQWVKGRYSEKKCRQSYKRRKTPNAKYYGQEAYSKIIKQLKNENNERYRNKLKCIDWVRKKNKRDKLCRDWNNGKIADSELERNIKILQSDLSETLLAEKKEKIILRNRQESERLQQALDKKNTKKRNIEQKAKRRYEKNLKQCQASWDKKISLCACAGFKPEDTPAWIKNMKTCTE